MANLIIISGDLAAGKSTLAASLGYELNLPYITKDSLKEIACDAIGYTNREENRKLSIAATDSMIYFFNQCAEVNNSIILEANFRHDEIERIKEIADANHYQVLLINLTGNINLLYQRFIDRLANRHIAHQSLHLDYSIERFTSYILEIRNQDLLYPAFTIDMSELDEDEVTAQALTIIHQELGI
jgi:deoxyadenosine/deoxycytidine kinase